ncbi:unnamed protein product [Mytilus coruscus]|uniref:TIR domain-containing protein n=1 Tax=Mytilus coruscus TaxID=42192 RepID=A0A6J8AEC7_MYTCO|nr:unnamed protein product [Mytilus coruscus]
MLGHKEAQCNHQGLTSVPINLPPDIKNLDLSYNRLTRLDANVFLRYKYLEHLMLDNNVIRLLHEKAFNGLSLLKYLSMSNNYLNITESYPPKVFESLKNLSVLDISRNMKTREYNPYRIPVGEICNLRELSIDLVFNATFGQQFKELHNLQKLRFDYCHVNFLYNETFLEMPGHIKEFHMTTCKDFVVVEVGVLIPFPHLTVLNLTNSNIHLTQALQLLHPFQNKSLDAILFRRITHADFKHGLDSVILTPEMMKYISTICIKSLDLSDNDIILVRNRSLSLFQHPECFKNVMLSANSFSLDNWALDFFILVSRMTNIEIFDFSYFPLRFKNPIFLDVITNNNHTRVEQVQSKWTKKIIPITVTLPNKKIWFVRITHLMASNSFRELKVTNSSLRHLELSYFETDIFPVITMKGFNSLEHLDLSGISSDITIGVGKVPLLIHLRTLILKETKLYNVLQTNTTVFSFCPNIMNLDISHNYIWKIKTLGQLRNLKQLNLSHNLLDNFPKSVTKLENIAELDLSHNQLTTVGKKTLDWIDTQHKKLGTFKLYLSDNPLICSCGTTVFLRWILKTKVKLDNNELQEKIENEWGFKICIEDRDFILGESIATERATFINRCRHIIFVVSPSIIENEWSRFEIERAKYEKFSKNLQKIVVITRDIALDNIPVEFSIIWKDVLLIQWPVEKDEVQMAWQKLRLWFF